MVTENNEKNNEKEIPHWKIRQGKHQAYIKWLQEQKQIHSPQVEQAFFKWQQEQKERQRLSNVDTRQSDAPVREPKLNLEQICWYSPALSKEQLILRREGAIEKSTTQARNRATTPRQNEDKVESKKKPDIMNFDDLRHFFYYIIDLNKPNLARGVGLCKINDTTAGRIILASILIYLQGPSVNHLIKVCLEDLHRFFFSFAYINLSFIQNKVKKTKMYILTPNQMAMLNKNPVMILFVKQRIQKQHDGDSTILVFSLCKNHKVLRNEQNKHLKLFGNLVGKYYTVQSLHNNCKLFNF